MSTAPIITPDSRYNEFISHFPYSETNDQEKAEKGDTVMSTSTRLFKGRVVADSDRKKGESLLASTPVVVLSAILGRTPSIEEYRNAVSGISLTKFSPPTNSLYS